MISLHNLSKTYSEGKPNQVKALKSIDLELPDSGLVSITGKSGCGKTTLLNLLGMIDVPTSGTITISGTDVTTLKSGEYDKFRAKEIGYIFQDYNLLEGFSILDNIAIGCEITGEKLEKEIVKETLEKLELPSDDNFLKKKARELSGGQKQRVAIARALLRNSGVILCDEPTGALDEENARNVFSVLRKVSKNTLVICVTHEKDYALEYSDRVIEMSNGEIVGDTAINEDRGKSQPDKIKGRKGGLRLVSATKIALGTLFRSKTRMVVACITTLFAMIFSAMSLSLNLYDSAKFEANSILQNGLRTGLLVDRSIYSDDSDSIMDGFNSNQIELVDEFSGGMACKAHLTSLSITIFEQTGLSVLAHTEAYYSDYYAAFGNAWLVEVDDSKMDYLGISFDERIENVATAHLPVSDGEIGITDFWADYIVENGVKGADSIADVIGMEIDGKTITTVLSTEVPKDFFEVSYKKRGETYSTYLKSGFYNPLNCFFVPKGSLEYDSTYNNMPNAYAINVSNPNALSKLIKKGTSFSDDLTVKYTIRFMTEFSSFSSMVENVSFVLNDVGRIVIPIIIAFSALIVANFALGNIDSMRRELGLLKVLGCNVYNMCSIGFVQSMTTLVGIGVLSTVGISAIVASFNAYMGLSIVSFEPIVLLLLIAMVVTFSFVSTIFIFLKYRKKDAVSMLI